MIAMLCNVSVTGVPNTYSGYFLRITPEGITKCPDTVGVNLLDSADHTGRKGGAYSRHTAFALDSPMYPRPWPCKVTGSVVLFLLASVLYIGGLCPTIYWYDSPEFVTTAHTLGISHPAGSPTYSLFAKLVTFFPLGSVALRVNAFSALVGACSIALLFSLLYELLGTSSAWIRGTAAARWGAVSPGLRVVLAFCRSCRSLYAAELLSDTPLALAAQGPQRTPSGNGALTGYLLFCMA